MSYTITREDKPEKDDIKVLQNGLSEFGTETVGATWSRDIAFYLRDAAGEIIGGVYGNFGSFGWVYVDTLWISPDARGKGLGRSLMERIESEGFANGCTAAFLNTFSFQAPEFYKKLGYETFGELNNFPGEHKKIFLRKILVQPPANA